MGAVSTSVSTFPEITAALATMASCWLTMATTAWVRMGVLMGTVSGGGNTALELHPWGTHGNQSVQRENAACETKDFQVLRYHSSVALFPPL